LLRFELFFSIEADFHHGVFDIKRNTFADILSVLFSLFVKKGLQG